MSALPTANAILGLDSLEYIPICNEIAQAISSASDVYFRLHPLYAKGVHHWASTSEDVSACVVEVGSAADIAIILDIVSSTQTPFAVKGGGHATNPGASSTPGVHISMFRFSEVTYNPSTETATIGSGLVWDDVYAALAPLGRNVVGGRVTGVGVAGFSLGGGYSWLSNERGLTIDSIVSYELVKPTGEIVTVTKDSDSELFWGLKGGMNNFGIVTKFVMKTYPQGQVWGGLTVYDVLQWEKVNEAVANYCASVTDPKASMIASYQVLAGVPTVGLLSFYNGPTPPPGVFDEFEAIPHVIKNVKSRSFLDLVLSAPANVTTGQRARFQTASVDPLYSLDVIKAVANQTLYWGTLKLPLGTGIFQSYAVEPFLPDVLQHTTEETAFPPSRVVTYSPLNVFYGWISPLHDGIMQDALRSTVGVIEQAARSEGQFNVGDRPLYPNYAMQDVSLERIYGANLPRLRALKARVDPDNVMGLAGGFKITA
ncbi:hypothetical protein BKA70DRAFT_1093662 [Coprinopsis sp. MPI-PUGE-AT-0042]|nr:hypothetical protein BKA70DRAFT_1093662 [Coprinopsis sp. MPI-PUGE-AT-0042]